MMELRVNKRGRVRSTFSVDADLFMALRNEAHKDFRDMSDVLNDALKLRYVSSHTTNSITPAAADDAPPPPAARPQE